ncbi:TFIIE alpha subunit-domain-containing protein [Epithele typhae]|uniref:TFIIE alpha subunit-domain-containing protein n=1 Tax=Epithele typhae TaxID=378194 RepID=UPI002008A6BD|nr:TFIIE alpha subunit-domain-containing protein [Epithele typhae]KAH9916967.1 TFIIE alpha subunit-domain-containing protein [Epithele typhae]
MAQGISKDEQETLRLLVQHVSRAFYEAKYTVIMDQLIRHPVLKDDDLAGRMGLQLKELNKIMATLETHNLVRIYRQNELKEGAQRSVGRQYFYIDYQSFCNVVKWRMAEMRRVIDKGLRNELDTKGYVCPQCKKAYQALEADRLVNFETGLFHCDVCGAELVDNENAENVVGSQDRMQRFNRQMRFILDGLRKTEDMVLPNFDVAHWIRQHLEAERAKAAARDGGLKIAGGSGDGRAGDTIGVVLSVDKDEETARAERDREAEAKRQQNALPLWHLQSTISGDLTALGIKESARAEAAAVADGNRLPSSNDAILKGLGTANGGAAAVAAAAAANGAGGMAVVNGGEDAKLGVGQTAEAEYYERYYATLAASAAPSGMPTPRLSDFGEDEEDVKPDLEYLDSLNEYRKRSRSREDVGDEDRGTTPKLPRTEGSMSPPALDAPPAGGADDPIVYVNGGPVPFSLVTEEHQEAMSPEEYAAYYEVMTARL